MSILVLKGLNKTQRPCKNLNMEYYGKKSIKIDNRMYTTTEKLY
jgi:hypothetical protein